MGALQQLHGGGTASTAAAVGSRCHTLRPPPLRCRGVSLVVRCMARSRQPSGSSATADRSTPREVVVGIDLGTTNSAVAVIENGRPRCVPNSEGATTTPSVVTMTPDGKIYVGVQAKRMAVLHPGTSYSSVKRLIGREFDDPAVQLELPRLPYKVSG